MELKANELRIGNFIADYECEPYFFKVEEIRKYIGYENWIYYREGSIKAKEVQPIPLTEEWLLKFGFKHIMNNWYNLHVNGNTFNVYIFEDGRYRVEIVSQSIGVFEFVHTLQNLFYSIGGKELEIKM